MTDVRGSIVLVTGGASGIGQGLALAFAERGARVAVADVDAARGADVAAALRRDGHDAAFVALDVTDRSAWSRVLAQVEARWGAVDILCSNAGASALGMPVSTLAPETWDRVVQLNLTSVYNGVAAVVQGMRARGRGHLVNTASIAGLTGGFANGAAYTATKFGVVGLSESLAAELAPHGIGVTVVCPGAVRTSLWKTSGRALGLPEKSAEEAAGSPSASADAMDPLLLGRLVCQAVEENRLYVVPHREFDARLAARFEAIRQGADWVDQALQADGALARTGQAG